jgi:DNA polymerase III psi subunit
MDEARRRAYLEALGHDVWLARPEPSDGVRLLIQPGGGDALLVADRAPAPGDLLAEDIARALNGKAVWSWPDPAGMEGVSLEDAIEQHLFTRVVLFGTDLASRLFDADVPLVIGSARIVPASGLAELAAGAEARRTFWKQLSGSQPGR